MDFKTRYDMKAVMLGGYKLKQESSVFWCYKENPKFFPIYLSYREREGSYPFWHAVIAYGDPFAEENEDKDEVIFASRKIENAIRMAEDYLKVRPLTSN